MANIQTHLSAEDGRYIRRDPNPSATRQEHKEEAEINTIVERFDRTGQLTHVSRLTGQYIDVSNIGSFQEALAMAEHGQGVFNNLPSSIRTLFDNNAAAFMDFMATATPEELSELGLTTAPKPSEASNQRRASDGPPVETEGSTEPPAASTEA